MPSSGDLGTNRLSHACVHEFRPQMGVRELMLQALASACNLLKAPRVAKEKQLEMGQHDSRHARISCRPSLMGAISFVSHVNIGLLRYSRADARQKQQLEQRRRELKGLLAGFARPGRG